MTILIDHLVIFDENFHTETRYVNTPLGGLQANQRERHENNPKQMGSRSRPLSAASTMKLGNSKTLTADLADTPTEYLAFRLGNEEYGIDIQVVRELRSYEKVTRIANAPAHVKGVINLRGVIVPIVDMRLRFSELPMTYDHSTVVIIVGLADRTVGLVVDSVSDVVAAKGMDISPAPALSNRSEQNDILALAVMEGRMLILLNIPTYLSKLDANLASLSPMAEAA